MIERYVIIGTYLVCKTSRVPNIDGEMCPFSLSVYQHREEYDIPPFDEKDNDFLSKIETFTSEDLDWSCEDLYDIVDFDTISLDVNDYNGEHEEATFKFKEPDGTFLARLQSLMKYDSIEVKQGVLFITR